MNDSAHLIEQLFPSLALLDHDEQKKKHTQASNEKQFDDSGVLYSTMQQHELQKKKDATNKHSYKLEKGENLKKENCKSK